MCVTSDGTNTFSNEKTMQVLASKANNSYLTNTRLPMSFHLRHNYRIVRLRIHNKVQSAFLTQPKMKRMLVKSKQ